MPALRNILLKLAYDGTDFAGWQRQRQRRTVQQVLEEALEPLVGGRVQLLASGRTDAGVHALGQVANFRTDSRRSVQTFFRALNATLPADVRVLEVREVPLAFHATYDARAKLYRYVFCDASVVLPQLRRFVARSVYQLDVAAMQRGAGCLLGRHDFRAFQTAGAPRASTIRTIYRCRVFRSDARWLWHPEPVDEPDGNEGTLVYVEVAADGFLYNMVRAIAGTLYNVGRGHWSADAVAEILRSGKRPRAGPTAPPEGLYLVKVWYDDLPEAWIHESTEH